jgi:hypothetical protein
MGSDGTLGLREIKQQGGFAIVQDPADAEYDGMPRSAIVNGMGHLRARFHDAERFAEIDPKLESGFLGFLEHFGVDDRAEADVELEEIIKRDQRQAGVGLGIV